MRIRKSILAFVVLIMTLSMSTAGAGFQFFGYADDTPSPSVFLNQTTGLDPKVLKLALHAYAKARSEGIGHSPYLTIIDYSKPSTAKRFWVLDLAHQTVPFHALVTHGKNSGDNYAKHFSNRYGSLESSLGVFVTGQTYVGHHGYSLQLKGLEEGFNDHALARHVVIHPAAYATEFVANHFGRLGRSWGCPALSPAISKKVINKIKGGSVVFAYYPQADWLQHSSFLN